MKRNKLLSITVGIAAYNEGSNIGELLRSILKQLSDQHVNIIVVSDGSTDKTDIRVMQIQSERIMLLRNRERKGKVACLNTILDHFNQSKSQILITIDGDVRLGNNALKYLLEPFLKDKQVDLICGNHIVRRPQTFIESVAKFGIDVWNLAIDHSPNNIAYRATGQIRAISQNLAMRFKFPKYVSSSEDAYLFFYAAKNNFVIKYAPRALIYFEPPSTIIDYLKQMKRLLKTESIIKRSFGNSLVLSYYTMNSRIKYTALITEVVKTKPYIWISYICIQLLAKLSSVFYTEKRIWDISLTTKD